MARQILRAPISIDWPDNSALDNEATLSALSEFLSGSDMVRREKTPSDKKTELNDLPSGMKSHDKHVTSPGQKSASGDRKERSVSPGKKSGDGAAEISAKSGAGTAEISSQKELKSYVFVGFNSVMRAIEGGKVSLVLLDSKFIQFSVTARYLGLMSEEHEGLKMCKIEGMATELAKILKMRRVSVIGFSKGAVSIDRFIDVCSGLKSVRFVRRGVTEPKNEEGENSAEGSQKKKKKRKKVSEVFTPPVVKLMKK